MAIQRLIIIPRQRGPSREARKRDGPELRFIVAGPYINKIAQRPCRVADEIRDAFIANVLARAEAAGIVLTGDEEMPASRVGEASGLSVAIG